MTTIFDKAYMQLVESSRPLYLYDDDVDGVCSFLQLYKSFEKKGRGIICKSSPKVEEIYVSAIEKYAPDLIVVLDKPLVSDAIFSLNIPIIWIDHHLAQHNYSAQTTYINSRLLGISDCTSQLVYTITQSNPWLCICGCVSDWQLPKLKPKHRDLYPELGSFTNKSAPKLLFNSSIGKLIDIIGFNLKGKSTDVKKSIEYLSCITKPLELFEQQNEYAMFLYKRYTEMYREFQEQYLNMKKQIEHSSTFVNALVYHTNTVSITRELSNKLHFEFPKKIIIVCRLHNGEYKCSLRSPQNIDLATILDSIFQSIPGHGGGHKNACGACVKEDDWEYFLEQITEFYS